jgi:bla regulator protein blaR1
MTAFIIKSSISLLLMFGLYWLILRREKLFVFNRFFLLFAILFSFIIPFVSIPIDIQNNESKDTLISVLFSTISGLNPDQILSTNSSYQPQLVAPQSSIDVVLVLKLLYLSGVVILLIRFITNILQILKRTRLSETLSFSGQRLALIDQQINPYCFLNTMFVNKEDFLNNKIEKELLYHELEHIKQSHTIDVILIELIQIIFWFNPILLLYNRAIRINHEFLADHNAIRNSSDIKSYSEQLLNFVCFRKNIPLTTGFNQSLIKKRLFMLTKSNPSKVNIGIRIFLTLNISLLILVLMGFKNSDAKTNILMVTSNTDVIKQVSNTVKGFVVNKYGRYIDGLKIIVSGKNSGITTDKMGHFEINNIPADASLTFSCEGYITQTLKPVFTSEMVVRLAIKDESSLPSLPKEKIINTYLPKPGTTPLIIIDNVVEEKISMYEIDPNNQVDSFLVLKGKDATDKYGEKGKNGVIEILTIGKTWKSRENKKAVMPKAEPILIVDDVISSKKLNDIPLEDIQSMTVLKEKNATEKYGEKGMNGVIEITTKRK